MIVVMDEPESSIYGGVVSAPVFRRIAERWLSTMPEVASGRMERLAEAGAGDGAAGDRPATGESNSGDADEAQGADRRPPETPLRFASLETSDGAPTVMPDLQGLGLRTALAVLSGMGVRARIEGHGRVAEQKPKPGARLPTEATLTLN
jgi:cell division protein FtsI (penicillin-binding protein 3)